MQEHRQEPHQNPPQEHFALPVSAHLTSGQNPPDSVSMIDARVEVYLDAICALMPADVPAPALAEMRREMQDHLQAALAAMKELEYTPEESAEHAFVQFGEPQVVAKHWRQEWEKTLAHTDTGAFWPSLKTAAKIWSLSHAIFAVSCGSFVLKYSGRTPFWTDLLTISVMFGLPMLTGAAIGSRARGRPVLCALLGYGLTLPVAVFSVLLFLRHILLIPGPSDIIWRTPAFGFGSIPPLLLFQIQLYKVGLAVYSYSLLVLPIGLLGAAVTSLGRRIRTRSRRQIAR